MALILLRHTRTVGGAGRCVGAAELALAPGFAAEAASVASRLGRPDRIVTSPAGRCRRLAAHLGRHFGLPVAIASAWSEMDFGRWQGRTWDAIPRAEIDGWAGDFLEARPHGGESVAMLLARTRAALEAVRALPGTTLGVTHEGVIRAALVATGAGDAAWRRPVGHGEAVAIDLAAVVPAPADAGRV